MAEPPQDRKALRIGIVGASGRMGRMLIGATVAAEGCTLAGALERAGSPAIGQDAGEVAGLGRLGIVIAERPESLFDGGAVDAVIEFSTPEATLRHAALSAESGIVHVIGTTGLDTAAEARLAEAALSARLVYAANMSLGVNLLLSLVEQAARRLGPDYDIEVLEMHHRHKVDAPSGTALALGRAAASGRGVGLGSVARMQREGQIGARPAGEIGFATLRGGDVAGDHSVMLAADGELITLSHRATDRRVFARGAVRAAQWAADQPPGLYSMQDVLGL